jgi:hypothetical protein
LVVGDVLSVYSSGGILSGVEDQQFYLPGEKVGEVQVIAASQSQAEARILTGRNIMPDSLVRYASGQ